MTAERQGPSIFMTRIAEVVVGTIIISIITTLASSFISQSANKVIVDTLSANQYRIVEQMDKLADKVDKIGTDLAELKGAASVTSANKSK